MRKGLERILKKHNLCIKRSGHTVPKQLLRAEKKLRRDIQREFKSLAQNVSDRLQAEDKWLQEDIDAQILQSHTLIINYITYNAQKIRKYWNKVLVHELSVDVDRDLFDEEAVSYMNSLTDLHLSQKAWSILVTTQTGIAKTVASWIQEWLSYWKIADNILSQVKSGVLSKARAELIAVNQLAKAYEFGRNQVIQYSKREWMVFDKIRDTVNDSKVTRQCNANAWNWWIEENKAFWSWDQTAPRDDHPRCRCTTNYRVVEHWEFYDDTDTTYDTEVWPKW